MDKKKIEAKTEQMPTNYLEEMGKRLSEPTSNKPKMDYVLPLFMLLNSLTKPEKKDLTAEIQFQAEMVGRLAKIDFLLSKMLEKK